MSLEDIYYTADYAVNTYVSSMSYHSHELVQNSNSSYVQYTYNPWQSQGDFVLYSSGSFTSGSFISEDMTIRASYITIEYLSTNISNITCIGETVVPKKGILGSIKLDIKSIVSKLDSVYIKYHNKSKHKFY